MITQNYPIQKNVSAEYESHFADLFVQSSAVREKHSLRILIDSHLLPIAVVNAEREIVFCNEQYASLIGFSHWTQVVGMKVPSFFFDEHYREKHSTIQDIVFTSLLLNTVKEELQPEAIPVDCMQFQLEDNVFTYVTIAGDTVEKNSAACSRK